MFCDRCGTNLQSAPAFCPTCGKSTGMVPLAPPRRPAYPGRIAGHLRNLAVLWIAFSVLRMLPRLFYWTFWRHSSAWLWGDGFPFGHVVEAAVGISMVMAVAGVITGWGLLERQSWARMLAIVLGFLALFQIPFGTALGIYTLWVLLPAQSEQEYRQIST